MSMTRALTSQIHHIAPFPLAQQALLSARLANHINVVVDYGADPTGAADSTAAINNAFASGAKIIEIPGGTYKLTSQLQLYGNDVLVFSSARALLRHQDSAATGFSALRVRGNNITLQGLRFSGNKASPASSGNHTAINLDTAATGSITGFALNFCEFIDYPSYGVFSFSAGALSDISFFGCKFTGFASAAAIPPGCIQLVQPTLEKVRVAHCVFADNTGAGIGLRATNSATVTNNVTIVNNIFEHNLYVYTSIGLEILNGRNVTISGNSFSNARMGCSVVCDTITITGNSFYNHTSYAIEASRSTNIAITGNTFKDFTYGVIIYPGAANITVTGNSFASALSTALSASNLGWAVQFSQTGIVSNYQRATITGNTFYDCSGIRVDRITGAQISGNIFETIHTNRQCRLLTNAAQSANYNIHGNVFRTSVDAAVPTSGPLTFAGTQMRIHNNQFVSTTSSPNIAPAIGNAPGVTLDQIEVSNNYCKNFLSAVTLNAGSPTATNLRVIDNTADGCTNIVQLPTNATRVDSNAGYYTQVGDVALTVTPNSSGILEFTIALTANRAVTLSTTEAYRGQRHRIIRSAGGAFTLDVGGLKSLAINEWCDVSFNGSAWRLVGFGAL